MKAGLAQREPEMLERWERDGLYEENPGGAEGCAALRPARRPAFCER